MAPTRLSRAWRKSPWKRVKIVKLKMYIPDLNRVVDIELKAGPITDIALGDGSKRPLRKVEQLATLDGQSRPELSSVLWVDSAAKYSSRTSTC